MNCPSRTDDVEAHPDWNQNPSPMAGATRQDLTNDGTTNTRILRREDSCENVTTCNEEELSSSASDGKDSQSRRRVYEFSECARHSHVASPRSCPAQRSKTNQGRSGNVTFSKGYLGRIGAPIYDSARILKKFSKFVGPGFMVSVAYIDPGNYSTDVAAGASYRFRLLFVVLMSNIFAIFLQSLCIKLGTVTGLNLAEHCRMFLPRWLNLCLYFLAEVAIIATDIAEVIGTAIAINLLIPKIPLVAGCAISILDVLLILLFYHPNGSMKGLRAFEMFVVALVIGVVICFIIQLSLIPNTTATEVFRGYLPSSAIIQSKGLYQSCAILGATVMPHSLYLGSGIVQPRLLDYDLNNPSSHSSTREDSRQSVDQIAPPRSSISKRPYQPSLAAINFCLKYSIIELAISLFTFALFVNSAILIVAGASLHNPDSPSDYSSSADLFTLHSLLSHSLTPAAGIIFALALLLSGVSAGIVCTLAGQMVSEGALNWSMPPWARRLLTRSLTIVPSIIIAGAVGREGLSAALNASQVVLSIVLPFVSAPVVLWTAGIGGNWMDVAIPVENANQHFVGGTDAAVRHQDEESTGNSSHLTKVCMRNNWLTSAFAVLIWLVITAMNAANIILLAMGRAE